jgi:hypothetical protein
MAENGTTGLRLDRGAEEVQAPTVSPEDIFKARRELRFGGICAIVMAVLQLLFAGVIWRIGVLPFVLADIVLLAAVLVLSGVTILKVVKYLRDMEPDKLSGDHATCAECKGMFNVRDLIAHAGVYVCASCKPRFLQKLAEGAEFPKPSKAGIPLWLLLVLVACAASPSHFSSTCPGFLISISGLIEGFSHRPPFANCANMSAWRAPFDRATRVG